MGAFIFIFIYLLLPIVGIIRYYKLAAKMETEGVEQPPLLPYFLIFLCYIALIMVELTALFWAYTGLLFLVMLFATFAAPIIMLFTAIYMFMPSRRTLSAYHTWAFILSLLYPIIIGVIYLFAQAVT